MASALRSFASLNARARPTIGDTKTSAAYNDHMGWLLCDGRQLSTSDYVQLFNMIGYSFDQTLTGSSTFRIPDPKGRVLGIVGQADLPDVSGHPWELGDISGEETHLLLLSEVPAHNHNDISGSPGVTSTAPGVTSPYTHNHGGLTGVSGEHFHTYSGIQSQTVGGTGTDAAENSPRPTENTSVAGNHTHTIASDTHTHTIASNGGDQRHNNIQPTMWIGNLFIYGGRQWVAATPQSRAIQGPHPLPNTNFYRPQGPPTNIY
jgi:microcystin-dependent protein